MTTTPADPPSSREDRINEWRRLLKEDSPEGEFYRDLANAVRADMGLEPLEPLCEDCKDEGSENDDSEPQMDG